jgi:hypothetical protein
MVPQCARGDGRAWISISIAGEAYVDLVLLQQGEDTATLAVCPNSR